jgi:hypothetical protein
MTIHLDGRRVEGRREWTCAASKRTPITKSYMRSAHIPPPTQTKNRSGLLLASTYQVVAPRMAVVPLMEDRWATDPTLQTHIGPMKNPDRGPTPPLQRLHQTHREGDTALPHGDSYMLTRSAATPRRTPLAGFGPGPFNCFSFISLVFQYDFSVRFFLFRISGLVFLFRWFSIF